MIYILDANTLIDAKRDYYPIKSIPEFWEWLIYKGNRGEIKITLDVYEEVSSGNDDLAEWIKESEAKSSLVLADEADISLVQKVLKEGYAKDLSDTEIEKLGRDPFIIANALKNPEEIVVVTKEPHTLRTRANKNIPEVCDVLGVKHCTPFDLTRILGFSTNWKQHADE